MARGIVEYIHVVILLHTAFKNMYICGKLNSPYDCVHCFLYQCRKRCVPKVDQLKKNSTYFCQKRSLCYFHEAGGLQNEQRFPFQAFEVSKLWKDPTFVKRCIWVVFHQAVGLQMSKVCFLSFWSFRAFKIPPFCQKMCLVSFFTKQAVYKMNKVCLFSSFWNLKFKRFENLLLLSKEMFE